MPNEQDAEGAKARTTAQSPERPITAPEEDQLERSGFIARLCDAVIDQQTAKATGVIIGVTGPWGSGKSSILNLLEDHLRKQYRDVVVVRFDPWLVSGRNDLIGEFLADLVAELKRTPGIKDRAKSTISKLVKYGSTLSPLAELVPMYGAMFKGAMAIARERLDRTESLHQQRSDLIDALSNAPSAIIVLIDELDRVEDDEIRTLAQLVRSVADFPGISYVLAYDAKRVMSALGAGELERGRAYLEKIVQLQVPLPILIDSEIHRLIEQDLSRLDTRLVPSKRAEIERYTELRDLLVPRLISTPRDAKRLTASFSTLIHMVAGEVDWIDLLGFCALLVKAPLIIEQIKLDPDYVADDPLSVREIFARASDPNARADVILSKLGSEDETGPRVHALLGFLFPRLADDRPTRRYDPGDRPATSISKIRPLLTTLRLGLVPGYYSRDQAMHVLSTTPAEVTAFLQEAYQQDRIGFFVDKLTDLGHELSGLDQGPFWSGIAQFLRKPDDGFISPYEPMRELVRAFSELFIKSAGKSAHEIYLNLLKQEEVELTSSLMRFHIFHHGLFGHSPRQDYGAFMESGESATIAHEVSIEYRNKHLTGRFFWGLWEWQSLCTMIDTGIWDDACRLRMKEFLMDPRGVDALTLMLFGSAFFTGRDTLSKIIDLDFYLECVDRRLEDPGLNSPLRVALDKAKNPPFG